MKFAWMLAVTLDGEPHVKRVCNSVPERFRALIVGFEAREQKNTITLERCVVHKEKLFGRGEQSLGGISR